MKYDSILRDILMDESLSWAETGLLCDSLVKPEKWQFTVKGFTKLHPAVFDEVQKLLDGLHKKGYLRIEGAETERNLSFSELPNAGKAVPHHFPTAPGSPDSLTLVDVGQDYISVPAGLFRDRTLTYEALGVLLTVLALQPNFSFTTEALRAKHRGKTQYADGLKNLEDAGYLVRHRLRCDNGQLNGVEFRFFLYPSLRGQVLPYLPRPVTAKPVGEASPQEIRFATILAEDRIGYADRIAEEPSRTNLYQEIREVMVKTLCSRYATVRIAKEELPMEVVQERLLKLTPQAIRKACLALEQANNIQYREAYLLTVLCKLVEEQKNAL